MRSSDYSLTEQHAEEEHHDDEHHDEDEHDEDEHDEHGHEEGPTTFENEATEFGVVLDLSNDSLNQKVAFNFAEEDMSIIGEEAFMNPVNSEEFTVGYYLNTKLGEFDVDFGVRLDDITRNGSVAEEHHDEDEHEGEEEHDEEVELYDLNFSTQSYAVQFSQDWTDNLTVSLALSNVERAPGAQELFMNGPHLVTNRFEVGDVNLGTEVSNNVDFTMNYENDGAFASASFYANAVDNYIYLMDESEADHEDHEDEDHEEHHGDMIRANYLQQDAEFNGYELLVGRTIALPNGSLTVSLGQDSVIGKFNADSADESYVPRLTPKRTFIDVDYSSADYSAGISFKDVKPQYKTAMEESSTEGFMLVDMNVATTETELSSSIKKYIDYFGVKCGQKVSLFTNNDSAYETAISLNNSGVSVNSIVDIRDKTNSLIVKQAEKLGIKVHWKSSVVNTNGYKKINSIEIMQLSDDGNDVVGKKIKEECDCLGISGGWTPRVHLFTQSGGKLKFRDEDNVFLPDKNKTPSDQISIGSCNGDFDIKDIILNSNKDVKTFLGIENSSFDNLKVESSKEEMKRNIWLLPSDKPIGKTKPFLDFQNDSTAKDVKLALREGFKSIEHVKRYTTTGMGTDQGKLSNMHALGIIAETTGTNMGELGTTTFRPPYTPLTFGAIVGRNVGEFFDHTRKTAMHNWHVQNKAKFENVGQWKRAWYYPKNGETMFEAVQRESKAARESVGILDASTLGKIDIQGTDASEFLNRVYTNAWSKLAIGKCRYGLMLNEDGMVYDDGVTTRLGENHYIMTTTTGGAANVLTKLEDYLQTEWPELDVYLTTVTDHFSTISICGPNSKKILSKVIPDLDLSDEKFPHMSFKNSIINGIKCRVMRISFTGEHSYEINIQSNYAKHVWELCMDAGKNYNITPYGTETMHLLRAEKGFIITGQDTDGTMTPSDLQMDWIIGKKKFDFIGKRSLYRSDTIRDDRKQLVGLLTDDPKEILEEGAQIVETVSYTHLRAHET